MNVNKLAIAALAIAGSTFASVPSANQDAARTTAHATKVFTIRDEASNVLKLTEEQSLDLNEHANTMLAGTSTPFLDREFYISQLDSMKYDVNQLGKRIAYLQAISKYESPAQKKVVERARPLLAQIAKTETAAIEYINQEPRDIEFPQYRTLASQLAGQTETLQRLLHDTVKLADLRGHEQHLRTDLKQVDETR